MTTTQHGTIGPFLTLNNICKRFGGTVALDGFDWMVDAGEIHCLVGENGSGKSTLVKIVAGVLEPAEGGRITIEERNFERLTPHRAKALGVQVIYQDLSLFPNLTALENIAVDHEIGSLHRIVDRKAMRETAKRALASLNEHLPLEGRVGELTVAQRQIVAICRGIASDAKLLFMDEPTASLTRREVKMLLGVVRRLKTLGVAVVFVSHRLEEIVEIAERVTVLRDGRKVGTYPAREIDDHRLAELMTGTRIVREVKARPVEGRRPMLEVVGASRPGEFADVSFQLHHGEVLGITGLLGAGRTELALALFGMYPLAAGEIRIDGQRIVLASNQHAIAAGIAYLSEDRLTLGLNLRQSIADNVALAVLDRLGGRFGFVTPKQRRTLASAWIGRLSIRAPAVDAAAQTLSGGNQQRLVLVKWLATNPKVLILDSPTVGVDIRNKQGIYKVVRELADMGMAILLITDEVPEAYFNCDRVLHMRAGRIMGEFVPGSDSEATLAEAVYA